MHRGIDMANIKSVLFDFYLRYFCLIVLISTAFAIVVPVTSDRSIVEKFTRRQNQIDKSSRLISCATTFIDEYFNYPSEISLLLPDMVENISDLIQPLMKELHTINVIYTLKLRLTDIIKMYHVSTNIVVLLESTIALEREDFSFVNYSNGYCNFIIVLTSPFIDKESFLIEADTLVQRMSSLQSIFKLAILASVGDSILSAGSLPLRVELLGICERQTAAVRWQGLTDKTRSSFNVSIVNAAIFNNFPYAFPINDPEPMSFGGVEGSMVEEMARNMKIELNREVIEQTDQDILEKELHSRFKNASVDLVFGGLLWDLDPNIEYTTSYGMVHVKWMVPIEANVSLKGLISPFNARVWYAIICVLIIGGLAKLFFIRDISFLDIAALVIGVATRHPKKISSRIQFVSWALFGFFLTQLYLGSLADQLMNASETYVNTMRELVESGLKVGGTQQLADLLETPDKDTEDNVRRTIHENFIMFDQDVYLDQILDIITGRNTSLALLVKLNLTDIRLSKIGNAHIMTETVGNYPLALATWHDFPYLREFNFKILMLVQAGLIEFWSDMTSLQRNNYQMNNDNANSKLDIGDIAPAFLLLIIGYLGGCCLLIIEIIFYPSKYFCKFTFKWMKCA